MAAHVFTAEIDPAHQAQAKQDVATIALPAWQTAYGQTEFHVCDGAPVVGVGRLLDVP